MKIIKYPYQAPLKDGEDLGLRDRGDDVADPNAGKPLTDEEKRVAEELKAKETAEAEAKAEADAAAKAKAEADGEMEDDPENPGKQRRKDSRIPVSRHKEILEAERAERAKLEARLAQYERGEDLAETNKEIEKAEEELVKLEAGYAKLLADGKTDEAAKEMTKIRRIERSINEAKGELRAQASEARAYERARYDITVDRIEAAYPEMSPKLPDGEVNPEFNAAKVKKVLSVSRAYQLDGMTPSAALQEAVKDILGDPKTSQQKTAVDVRPRVDDAAAKKAAREEEARRKAAEAAGKTPPNEKAGLAGDRLGGSLKDIDVMKLSQQDFAKLDESTLSQLRGDVPE